MMKHITILGSTGSIGVNSLKVIRAHPDRFCCLGLAAGKNISLLLEQVESFQPKAVCVLNEKLAIALRDQLPDQSTPEIYHGEEGFRHIATLPEIDTVISAMTGAAGLLPTYAAVKAGKNIALANKETMVMAGAIIMDEAKKQNVSVLPVDSEHSAIFQAIQGHPQEDIKRIVLTASGGPFRDFSLEDMDKVTRAQALNHPNWDMGEKITVDSATLMNKGLEAIEAKWFFSLDMDQIDILIHPQSVVHSMVEYKDGSVIAQLGIADMIIPIAYALSYPRHLENSLPSLQLDEVQNLTFKKPDMKRFRSLDLALSAAKAGGSMPTVLNGANEVAVAAFLAEKIRFLDIPDVIENTMDAHQLQPVECMEDIIKTDQWARDMAMEELRKWM